MKKWIISGVLTLLIPMLFAVLGMRVDVGFYIQMLIACVLFTLLTVKPFIKDVFAIPLFVFIIMYPIVYIATHLVVFGPILDNMR